MSAKGAPIEQGDVLMFSFRNVILVGTMGVLPSVGAAQAQVPVSVMTVEQVALAMESPVVQKKALELTGSLTDPSAKNRAIFDFVTQQINYDLPALKSGKLPVKTPAQTIQTRLGVCQDYANLYHALAAAAGLEVKTIQGHTNPLLVQPMNDKKPSHSWNLVKLNGRWYGVDTTWGSGYSTESAHVQLYDPYYSAIPSDVLALTHFDPNDTTGEQARFGITRANFPNMPKRLSDYARLGFSVHQLVKTALAQSPIAPVFDAQKANVKILHSPLESKLHTGKHYQFEIEHPDAEELMLFTEKSFHPFKRTGNKFKLDYRIEDTGAHQLAYRQPDSEEFTVFIRFDN